jgi:hypothetical protein
VYVKDEKVIQIADRVIRTRRETLEWESDGKVTRRTMGTARLAGATLDNEENYLIKKLWTPLGIVQVDNQARLCAVQPDQYAGRPVRPDPACEWITGNSGPDRTTAFAAAVSWTQHTVGSQYIRAASALQLPLGIIGRPGGGIQALPGHPSIQGSSDIPTLFNAAGPVCRLAVAGALGELVTGELLEHPLEPVVGRGYEDGQAGALMRGKQGPGRGRCGRRRADPVARRPGGRRARPPCRLRLHPVRCFPRRHGLGPGSGRDRRAATGQACGRGSVSLG